MEDAAEAYEMAVTNIFKRLPWHTNVLARLDDPQAVPKELEPFCRALISLGKQSGPNRIELAAFFQRLEAVPHTPLFDFPFSPRDKAQTASLIISHRILDVYALDKSPPFNSASFEKYGFKDPPHMGYRLLYNWGDLVMNASSLLEGAVDQAPPLGHPQTPSIRTYLHFFTLCRIQTDKQKVTIQCNFESAALYLSYLLEGNTDLPDSSDLFISIMEGRRFSSIGPIEKTFRHYNMQQLRAPLQTALAISPFCLVENIALNRATPGRPGLCQVWQALGSSRPELLRWAESQLWELLWDYTLLKIELLPSLQKTLKLIVTRVSEPSTSISDLTWFTPLRYKPARPLQNELKKLRLTPPPTYSKSDSDLSPDESLDNAKSTPATPVPLKRRRKQENKSMGNSSAEEEMSTDQGSDYDDDISSNGFTKSVNGKAPAKKRKKTLTMRRKPYKLSKNQNEVQTPSTQTRPLLRLDSVIPPYVEIINVSPNNPLAQLPRLEGAVVGQKIVGKTTHQLYGPGEDLPALYTPQSHSEEDLQLLTSTVERAESFYVNGRPRFMADPSNSGLCMILEAHFQSLADEAIQDILKTRQVVIFGPQYPTQTFDLNNLENIYSLDQPISIYDQSIPRRGNTSRLCSGTLLDIYSSVGSSLGKSLIALELPMTCGSAPPKSFASDIKAWSSMAPVLDKDHEFPIKSTRWAQVATAGGHHMWRIQRDGFSTFIEPQAGRQCWIIAKPKQLLKRDETFWKDFERIRQYTTNEGSIDSPDPALWDFEAILLKPGTRLIMRPNTPFLAIMPEPSISYGSRFFTTSTIRESCYGVFYTFISDADLNVQHSIDSRKMLRRILALYHNVLSSKNDTTRARYSAHIPKVHTFDGLLDLLTLCNIIEMGNVLTPKLYSDRDNCNRERHDLIEARKLSRTVIDWVFDHYQLSLNGSLMPKSRQAFYWPYLAQQAKTLLWYMQQKSPSVGSNKTGPTYEAVKHAIRCCFRSVVPFWAAWDSCQGIPSFIWSGPQFDIVPREPAFPPHEHDGKTVDDLIWLGESEDNSDMDDSFSQDMDSGDERLKKKARQD